MSGAAPLEHEPAPAHHPSTVDNVLAEPGQPLDTGTRAEMERRFGYDFASVRIHADSRAGTAAKDLQAHAFTKGSHVVMGDGEYRPGEPAGRELLTHELTHVVQQSQAGVQTVQRAGFFQSIGNFFAGVGSFIASIPQRVARLFGGGTFSKTELLSYLDTLRRTGQIEDGVSSDNKARDIVRRGKAGETEFSGLTEPIRVLLIKEMLSGYVSGDDEVAILDLLSEAPPNEALRLVNTVGENQLRASFSGANHKKLVDLIEGNQLAPAQDSRWSLARIRKILRHEGKENVLTSLAGAGWEIWSFETAFDKWRSPDGTVAEEEVIGLRGNTSRPEKKIRMSERLSDEMAASTLVHEHHHFASGASSTLEESLQQEVDARVTMEQYLIKRGLPPTKPGYRKADGTVDTAFIHTDVFGSEHYNPTTRTRTGARRWVGQHLMPGLTTGVAP